jgi:exonuclease SbcC
MELRNYRKFRAAALEFPDGVVGIIGQNGTGKSTLVEAVAWCLYGNEKSIVRTGKDGIRSSAAGPNDECSVLLVFSIEGDEYRLFRAMKGSSLSMDASLSVNGALKAKGDKHVTEAVEKLLGMDYTSFFISVFARQKELNSLSSLNPGDRKRYVLRMLGLDALDDVVKWIDQDGNEMRKVRDALQAELLAPNGRPKMEQLTEDMGRTEEQMSRIKEELESIQARMREVDAQVQAAKASRDALAAKDQEFRKVQRRQIDLQAGLRNADQNIAGLEKQRSALRSKEAESAGLEVDAGEFERLAQERDGLEAMSALFKERRQLELRREDLQGKSARLTAEIDPLEKENVSCEEARARLEEVERNLQKARAEGEELRHTTKLLESEVDRLGKQLKQLEGRREDISRLGPEGKCPTCERLLEDQHTVLLRNLDSEIEDARRGVAEHRRQKGEAEREVARSAQRLEALEKRRKDRDEMCSLAIRASEALDRLRAQRSALTLEAEGLDDRLSALGEVEFDEGHYTATKRRLLDLKPRADRHKELLVQIARLPEVQAELERLLSGRSVIQEQLAQVERELLVLGYQENSHREAQDRLDALQAERERIARSMSGKEKELAAKAAEEGARQARMAELLETERRVEERSRLLEEQSVLGATMKAFKSNIVGRVVPTLADLSSHMFSELTDSRYPGLELNENYEISVYDKGEKYPLSRFSGGESDLANLCLRLAISRVIAERSGSSVNFLILDEIFGSQDQVRKRNILEAFSQLSKQFEQIVLITHIEDVKDLVGNAIIVRENEDGSSSLQVVS